VRTGTVTRQQHDHEMNSFWVHFTGRNSYL